MPLIDSSNISVKVPKTDDYFFETIKGITIMGIRRGTVLKYVDVFTEKELIVYDFLCLCTYMEKIIEIDNYNPYRIRQESISAIMKTRIDYSNSVFDDIRSPFLASATSQTVMGMFHNFICKYGAIKIHGTSKVDTDTILHIRKRCSLEGKLEASSIMPLPLLLERMFEIYLRYKYPRKMENMIRRIKPSRNQFVRDFYGYDLSVVSHFQMSTCTWTTQFSLKNILDLIVFLLTENVQLIESVKICVYCGVPFSSTHKTKKYCSPTCKNNANSNRSYHKNKTTPQNDFNLT